MFPADAVRSTDRVAGGQSSLCPALQTCSWQATLAAPARQQCAWACGSMCAGPGSPACARHADLADRAAAPNQLIWWQHHSWRDQLWDHCQSQGLSPEHSATGHGTASETQTLFELKNIQHCMCPLLGMILCVGGHLSCRSALPRHCCHQFTTTSSKGNQTVLIINQICCGAVRDGERRGTPNKRGHRR